ncbi:MAG: intein-containing RctB family protein [Candidatus Aenigmatarchaeota archaeon]
MPFKQGELKKPEFKKITDIVWEIPTSFKHGMKVPVRIYAKENLLNSMDLEVFDQAANAAMFPGLLKYSYVFSDGHSGYGVPVGWCGAFDLKEGIISPGAIGFDINCVAGNTKIISEFGYFKNISDFEKKLDEKVVCMDLNERIEDKDEPILFLKQKPKEKVIKIKTKAGYELIATIDHPILTPNNMIKAGELKEGDYVAIYPFEGVKYEEPSDEIILDEESIIKAIGMRKKIIKELKDRKLLPLRYNSPQLPILARLVGFITGDGWVGEVNRRWSTRIIGNIETLEKIAEDIKRLGFSVQRIFKRKVKSKIVTKKEIREIEGTTTQLPITSQSFAILLYMLGVPKGNKSFTEFEVPKWIRKAPLWIKRLYLAGLFGAEMSKPKLRNKEKYGFVEPSFSLNKSEKLLQNAYKFINQIREMLSEFGVNCNKIYIYDAAITKSGEKTLKIILKISSKDENLIKLWSKIGCEYDMRKKCMMAAALHYLRLKKRFIKSLICKYKEIIISGGTKEDDIKIIGNALIRYKLGIKEARISTSFPTFETFLKNYVINSTFVWDEIEEITEINDFSDYVYDFTMNSENHNFIANNFVVSNCGMRLLKTNLTLDEIKPKIKELVDLLFKMVPAGVGATSYQEPKEIAKIPEGTFREIVETGVKWAVENGYAWGQDLERLEEYGGVKTADFSKVSKTAYSRGKSQIGTLGSGNHYLEIQVIDKIFNREIAEAWGLGTIPNQVCIMVHCGSRGFGHQICTDYLTTFLRAMEKYKIKVPDKQLACAPFESEEGQNYLKAMSCAINFAFVNRQLIVYQIRKAFEKIFNKSAEELGLEIIYDVAHNTAKIEEHKVNGERMKVIVHRKGATRSFGPNHPELAPLFKKFGQPVIVGGSMETGSFLCVGTKQAEEETFGTTLHGSGRTMSRTKAKKMVRGEELQRKMLERGIYVKATTMSGLAEEAGFAYKDINEVVDSMHLANISLKVLRLRPVANIKG